MISPSARLKLPRSLVKPKPAPARRFRQLGDDDEVLCRVGVRARNRFAGVDVDRCRARAQVGGGRRRAAAVVTDEARQERPGSGIVLGHRVLTGHNVGERLALPVVQAEVVRRLDIVGEGEVVATGRSGQFGYDRPVPGAIGAAVARPCGLISPSTALAVTANSYAVPLVRPVMVVCVAGGFPPAP